MKGPSVTPDNSLPGSTSSSLLSRLREQDPNAWGRLAKLYGPLVYSWCRRRGLQADDADDVIQEVFRSVARRIQDFTAEPQGSFRGWLWTITRSKIMDYFRRAQRRPDAPGGSDAQERMMQIPESLDESEAGSSSAGKLLRRALDMIRPDFEAKSWQAFWRVMVDGQPPAEVARSLGISVNAVYVAKSRVLRRLRDELGEDSC